MAVELQHILYNSLYLLYNITAHSLYSWADRKTADVSTDRNRIVENQR